MTIAIAGCGPVGLTVLEVLLDNPKYQSQIVVLTRTVRSSPLLDQVTQIKVDYDDIPAITAELEKHQVHTIVCTIGVTATEIFQSELALIEAAGKSVVTRRFMPSEYSFAQETCQDLYPESKYYIDVVNAIKKHGMEYTRVFIGTFLDYFDMPNIPSHIGRFGMGIDIENCRAIIPGDGNEIMTVTYSYDLAKYIMGLLDLESWPDSCYFAGEDVSYNQIVEQAEKLRGKKFDLTYVSHEQIKKEEVPPFPQSGDAFYDPETVAWLSNYLGAALISGKMQLPLEGRMNGAIPRVHPVSVSQLLAHAWKPNSCSTCHKSGAKCLKGLA